MEEQQKSDSHLQTERKARPHALKSKEIALYAMFSSLIVVLSLMGILMAVLPYPIGYLSFVPIVVFFIGITLKPKRAFIICVFGGLVGELLADVIGGYAGMLWLWLPGAFVARGFEGPVISILEKYLVRGKNLIASQKYGRELLILLIGSTWAFFGYVNVGALGNYFVVYPGMTYLETLISYLYVLVEFMLIPAGLLVVYGVRKYFGQEYFDRIFFNEAN